MLRACQPNHSAGRAVSLPHLEGSTWLSSLAKKQHSMSLQQERTGSTGGRLALETRMLVGNRQLRDPSPTDVCTPLSTQPISPASGTSVVAGRWKASRVGQSSCPPQKISRSGFKKLLKDKIVI